MQMKSDDFSNINQSEYVWTNGKNRRKEDFGKTLLYETGAGTACGHITMNFECQDGSFLRIILQKEVLEFIS